MCVRARARAHCPLETKIKYIIPDPFGARGIFLLLAAVSLEEISRDFIGRLTIARAVAEPLTLF